MHHPNEEEEPRLTTEEEQRVENQLRSMLFDAEMGSHSFASEDIPPELLEQFQANIRAFHAQSEAERTTIGAWLENPNYPAVTDFNDEAEITHAVEGILNQMEARGLVFVPPSHLSARGLYKFITNDLLTEEMVPPVPGQLMVLNYEELRQDGPEFIETTCEIFLLALLNLNEPFPAELLADSMRLNNEEVPKAAALEFIEEWRSQWTSLTPLSWGPDKPMFVPDNGMYFQFGVAYKGELADGASQEYNGVGILQLDLDPENYQWRIQGGTFPGFEF